MMTMSALYQTITRIIGFLQCQLTETTVHGQACLSTRTYYPDSEQTSLCSFSLILHAQRGRNKYKLYRLWFDPIGVRSYTWDEYANHYATDEVTLDICDDCHGSTYNASWDGEQWCPLYERSSGYNTDSLASVHSG